MNKPIDHTGAKEMVVDEIAKHAEILAQVRKTMADNVMALEAALIEDTSGSIYWYRPYCLGIKVGEGTKGQAVRVDLATRNPPNAHWRNGAGLKAERVAYIYALKVALSHAVKVRADFEARLASKQVVLK